MYIMINLKILSATEARTNLFKILKMVALGDEVIIVKKDTNQKFKINLLPETNKLEKKSALKELTQSNLKTKKWSEIEEILETRLND
mgnify:CR=1 FL=1